MWFTESYFTMFLVKRYLSLILGSAEKMELNLKPKSTEKGRRCHEVLIASMVATSLQIQIKLNNSCFQLSTYVVNSTKKIWIILKKWSRNQSIFSVSLHMNLSTNIY